MTNTYRNKRDVRRWSVGAALAAAGATMLGTAGLAVAHADDGAATDIGLLTTAQTDATEALTALNQLAAGEPVSTGFVGVIDKVADVQTPLLSSDNSLISGVGGLLFNGPDQQLAQSARPS